MAYIDITDITSRLPETHLIEALDDDGDGVIDAGLWDQVAADAGEMVDGFLGQRFAVPFSDPLPAVVKFAARIFALEILYERRGMAGDDNPHTSLAKAMRNRLGRIADGEEPLAPGKKKAAGSVATITEPARTSSKDGNLSH